MRKVTKAHAVAINKLMLPLINNVCGYIDPADNNMEEFEMYANDIAHNVVALCAFNNTLDAYVLYNTIILQDTQPREHFYTVLKYIEDNALINANAFCCM